MKKISRYLVIPSFIFLYISGAHAQIGIGTTSPNVSAALDVTSTSSGVLIPRVNLLNNTDVATIPSPATSLLVYNSGFAPNGYYYWTGSQWAQLAVVTASTDWSLNGNAGTTAGTNFIGTTDAIDFVTKTNGNAANNERFRIKSQGQVLVNNTTPFTGDVFSSYANNTTNGTTPSINNAIGSSAINGYASGSGIGVYGEVNGGVSSSGTAVWGNLYGTSTAASSTSEGIWGTNSTGPSGSGATAGVATGVRGESTGAAGTAFTMGVLGVNIATAGSAFGVYGQSSSPASMGVFGVNLDTSAAPAHGIQGQTAAIGSAAGIRGFNTATTFGPAQNGFGVRGSANGTPSGTGFAMGVRGDSSAASGTTYGVYGQSGSATGYGIGATNSNTNGTGLLAIGNNTTSSILGSGSGAAISGSGVGTFSIAKTAASGIGLIAVGNNLTGSIFAPTTGAGTVGIGSQYGVMGFATTIVNTNPLNNNASNGISAAAGGYFEVQNATVPQTWSYVGVRDNSGVLRKIIGPGTVNTIVNDLDGKRVALSCPEAPENLFQDYGQGVLVHGKAHIVIDPIFAKNIVVDDKHPLRVFVQLEGDCEGVFITNKTRNGFDVQELRNGTSNAAFSYTIVANRADEVNPDGSIARYSEERFPPAPGPQTRKNAEVYEDNPLVRNAVNQDQPSIVPVLKSKSNPKLLNEKQTR